MHTGLFPGPFWVFRDDAWSTLSPEDPVNNEKLISYFLSLPVLQYPVLFKSCVFFFFFWLISIFHSVSCCVYIFSLSLCLPIRKCLRTTNASWLRRCLEPPLNFDDLLAFLPQNSKWLRYYCTLWVPDIWACGRHLFHPAGMHFLILFMEANRAPF